MSETGVHERLSTRVLRQAIALLARAALQAEGTHLAAVLRVAIQHPSTWTTCVATYLEDLGAPTINEWAETATQEPVLLLTRTQKKCLVKQYLDRAIKPVLAGREAEWWSNQVCVTLPPPSTAFLAGQGVTLGAARMSFRKRMRETLVQTNP